MRKFILALTTAITISITGAGVTSISAAPICYDQNFVDANNDGICDNAGSGLCGNNGKKSLKKNSGRNARKNAKTVVKGKKYCSNKNRRCR